MSTQARSRCRCGSGEPGPGADVQMSTESGGECSSALQAQISREDTDCYVRGGCKSVSPCLRGVLRCNTSCCDSVPAQARRRRTSLRQCTHLACHVRPQRCRGVPRAASRDGPVRRVPVATCRSPRVVPHSIRSDSSRSQRRLRRASHPRRRRARRRCGMTAWEAMRFSGLATPRPCQVPVPAQMRRGRAPVLVQMWWGASPGAELHADRGGSDELGAWLSVHAVCCVCCTLRRACSYCCTLHGACF